MLIYHWTTEKIANKAISTNSLKKRRWKHFIEEKGLVSGTSWGIDIKKWQSNHEVCFVIDTKDLINEYHLINGNKTYLRTQGMVNNNFDPNAWKFESDLVDECFIIGDIENFKSIIKKIHYI